MARRPLALPRHVRGKRRQAARKSRQREGILANLDVKIFFIVGVLTIIALVNVLFKERFIAFLNTAPIISDIYLPIMAEVTSRSLLGLFYIAFLGSLFFLTVPVEASFFVFLKGHNPLVVVLLLVYGVTLSHLINYAIGHVIGKRVLHIVPKKQHRKFTKNIRQFGMVLVFIFNAMPLPAPMLSVVLGSLRYRFSRFVFLAACGQLVKYTFLMVIVNLL